MSVRTTEAAVKALFEADSITDSLTPYIVAANALVTKICAKDGNEYTDDDLELIERWLAAHFYTIRDNRVTSESAGGVSASYSISVGKYLASSMYGQTAMVLDTEGGLAALNKSAEEGNLGRRIGMTWLGENEDTTSSEVV